MAFTEGQNYSSENFFHAFPVRQSFKIFGRVGHPEMSKHLRTGHYLSPGGGGEDFRGDHLIFGRTKGGISRN